MKGFVAAKEMRCAVGCETCVGKARQQEAKYERENQSEDVNRNV